MFSSSSSSSTHPSVHPCLRDRDGWMMSLWCWRMTISLPLHCSDESASSRLNHGLLRWPCWWWRFRYLIVVRFVSFSIMFSKLRRCISNQANASKRASQLIGAQSCICDLYYLLSCLCHGVCEEKEARTRKRIGSSNRPSCKKANLEPPFESAMLATTLSNSPFYFCFHLRESFLSSNETCFFTLLQSERNLIWNETLTWFAWSKIIATSWCILQEISCSSCPLLLAKHGLLQASKRQAWQRHNQVQVQVQGPSNETKRNKTHFISTSDWLAS